MPLSDYIFSGFKEDQQFAAEKNSQRVRFNKATGQVTATIEPKDKPETVRYYSCNFHRTSSMP